MGSMAVVTNAAGSATSVTSMTSAIGLGVGGIFVSLALVYLLAYFNLIESSGVELAPVKRFVGAAIVPLSVVFAGIIAYQAIEII